MRILHFSDVHIGVENYGRLDHTTGMSTRLLDFLSTLDEVVSCAIDEQVDLALFCGDAYKNRDPNQTHQREFAKRIARLSSENIPVFLLMGNHDMPHIVNRATALEIFRTLEVDNVYTADSLKTHHIRTNDGPLQIISLPWIRRSNFLTKQDTQSLTPDAINEAIQERLANALRVEVGHLDNTKPAILAGHISISQATTSSEQSMMLGRDHILLKSDIALPQLDYVALGHIHRHQILGTMPHLVYSGSLQRIDFGEEKDQKGFCLFNLDPKKPVGQRLHSFEFRHVNARPLVTISSTILPGDLNPTETVVNKILSSPIENSIVRVIIKVPAELEGHIRDKAIQTALAKAHYVVSISKEIIEQSRTRLTQPYSNDLDPLNALGLYLKSRSVSKTRAGILKEHAERLLKNMDPE